MGKVSGKSRHCPCVPVEVCKGEEQCGGGMATRAGLLGFMLLQSDASGEESKQKALKDKKDPFWSTCFAHFSATPHDRLRRAFLTREASRGSCSFSSPSKVKEP